METLGFESKSDSYENFLNNDESKKSVKKKQKKNKLIANIRM